MTDIAPPPLDTRVTRLLGVDYPIVQAPMGWIARSQLASAVSNAGGLGIIETSSGELDAVREEIRKMRDLTDKPFGVNIAQLFVRDPGIVDFVIDNGVRFVTTSAGDPRKYTAQLKAAGLVQSIRGAGGGYRLVGEPREITLLDVMRVVDAPPEQLQGNAKNSSAVTEVLLENWQQVAHTEMAMLEAITLGDLAEKSGSHSTPMYYI